MQCKGGKKIKESFDIPLVTNVFLVMSYWMLLMYIVSLSVKKSPYALDKLTHVFIIYFHLHYIPVKDISWLVSFLDYEYNCLCMWVFFEVFGVGWGGRLYVKPKMEIKAIYCCEGKSRFCSSTFLMWILLLTDLHICYN